MSKEISVTEDLIKRLEQYKISRIYSSTNSISKSAYWESHSKELTFDTKNTSVQISGNSGFYVPSKKDVLSRVWDKISKVVFSPRRILVFFKTQWFSLPKLFSFENAFDLVMSHSIVSDPDLSPYRVNHLELSKNRNIFSRSKEVARHFNSWSNRAVAPHIYLHYYYLNLLKGYMKPGEVKRILEIGAGNGNFPSILFNDLQPVQYILVDLPEMVPISVSYLSSLFPKAKVILPNEIGKKLPKEYDFLFLTTTMIKLIPDNYVDLSINCHSFQEMVSKQISVYFDLVQRVTRKNGYFFTTNRIEKIPVENDAYTREQKEKPNRFFEFPWKKSNEILINEVSRFLRLVQLDAVGIRLERIRK
ncbi:putative sugar O-methyltransferase [Leptospira yasudae]|uniref:putative sugar O-methyltransferase n=1 Tax=Leptospira yasudae TaxID=2202201 RepID=UPI001C4F6BDE|nr:putative sugar O-methyltransferase [Leptospira yasudae]MBW0434128.1 putative sugar O-methyltransferase [Leptospira yasudae]